ncbi:MAG: hypothetical protein H6Q38_2051 [Chloroflexi bacterium]|jgi:hypothetical protein|nr:hypothetical protein [Chloroflexota bacterium]
MRKIYRIAILILIALLATAGIALAAAGNFRTHLSGDEEVPPQDVVIETLGQGQAIFRLSEDGTELHYKLIVANIENVVASHIHIGAPGINGPVVVWLFPSTTPGGAPAGGGRLDGGVAEGTITANNFVGPLAGQPFSALIDAIESGNAYVNVHTNDGIAPTNTGPGDFPGGEIRGQLFGHDHNP